MFLFFGIVITALAKEDGNGEDMAEMIAFEFESLSSELKAMGITSRRTNYRLRSNVKYQEKD